MITPRQNSLLAAYDEEREAGRSPQRAEYLAARRHGVPVVDVQRALIAERQCQTITLTVTREDAGRIAEALDSHVYWQLSDEHRRDSGYVLEPYTEEEQACMELENRVREALRQETMESDR